MFQLNVLFLLSDCRLLEDRDMGVMTLVSPKGPHVGADAQLVSSLMETHPSRPSAPVHPATLPSHLWATSVVCTEADDTDRGCCRAPALSSHPRRPAFTGAAGQQLLLPPKVTLLGSPGSFLGLFRAWGALGPPFPGSPQKDQV